jgi:4-amino-4-deoxy-L-arabinose transferase-like glycosyltransferase
MQLILLFVSAFLIRLIGISQSLWLDESIVAKVAQTIPFHQIITGFSPADVHPPLYYLFMTTWSSIFGVSEIALRMPSVIFSLIAGWYVYRIGGKWAAAFFLFNPLVVYYSQEARMHMMATMFLSITLYYFTQLTKEIKNQKSKSKNIFLFNLFSALAMGVFYGSGFFIAAMIVSGFFLIQNKKEFIYLFIGLFISLIFLSPLLYQQLLNSKAGLAELTNWTSALGNVNVKNLLLFPIKFATGRLSWYPKWSFYLIAGVPTLITWIVVVFGMKKNKVLASLLILPLLFGILVSFVAPMMMYFRFLYLIPVMSLLIGNQIGKPIVGQMKIPIGFVILFFYCVFSLVYIFVPVFHREDWKSAARELKSSTPLYMIIPSSDPITYYRSDVTIHELRTLNKNTIPETIQVIPYTSDLYGIDYASLLRKSGCVRETQASFRGDVVVETWKCLKNA